MSLAPLGPSGAAAVAAAGRGLFCLAVPSGGVDTNAVPIAPTPATAILYSVSLGSPGGGLDARIKACVAIYPASGVLGMMFPLVSIDMKDMSRFWTKCSLSASGICCNLDLALFRASLWLSPEVLDCRLRSALLLLDAEAASFLLFNSAVCFSSSLAARASLY